MTPGLRKLALTAHITLSVGWLGAVVAFLALACAGLTAHTPQAVQAVYLAAEPMNRFAIVPLAVGSLVSGIVQSLTSPWGLFRHYWVLFKLLLTVFSLIVLVEYIQTVKAFASLAAETADVPLDGMRSYLLHSGGALLVLLVTTTLSVFKPRGMTAYGRRRQNGQGDSIF